MTVQQGIILGFYATMWLSAIVTIVAAVLKIGAYFALQHLEIKALRADVEELKVVAVTPRSGLHLSIDESPQARYAKASGQGGRT